MTASPYQQTADELEALLRRELELYVEVREISRSQKDLILQSDANALMLLIAEKQTRLDRIAELEQSAAPLKQRREAELERWPAEARAKVDPLVRELQTTLGEIVSLEEESRALVESTNQRSSQQVARIQRGKAMLNAYGKAARGGGASPRYSDRNI